MVSFLRRSSVSSVPPAICSFFKFLRVYIHDRRILHSRPTLLPGKNLWCSFSIIPRRLRIFSAAACQISLPATTIHPPGKLTYERPALWPAATTPLMLSGLLKVVSLGTGGLRPDSIYATFSIGQPQMCLRRCLPNVKSTAHPAELATISHAHALFVWLLQWRIHNPLAELNPRNARCLLDPRWPHEGP